ncbi:MULTISPECIES: DUF4255 domain-containing protein [Streptomyces]|uniref:DUF4255 domain-containing protein n=1 Tax=Streptomyces TaxID=1883 RepID=UPI0021D20E43|nr:DUF4255 domain-containing protein [Streptomyces sp. G-5]MCU4748371.1 DUF4255 domain-containing protein [Streptomyces sp. G-5]
MIHEVDEVLKGLLGGGSLTGSGIDVSFEVPSRDWAARRNGPVINAYLYDIREDTSRRQRGQVAVRDDRDITVKRRETPRWLRLSYLVTAWTKQPEDEHRLLSAVLATLLPRDTLNPSELPDSLRALGMPVLLTVAGPHGEARSLADIWSALGGELKPSVDVTLTAPFPLTPEYDVAPPIKQAVVRARGMSDGPSAAERSTQRSLSLPKPRAGGSRDLRPIRRTRAIRRKRAT